MWPEKVLLSNTNKKSTCAVPDSGVICQGQHILHSRIFIQLATEIEPTDFEWGLFSSGRDLQNGKHWQKEASIKT